MLGPCAGETLKTKVAGLVALLDHSASRRQCETREGSSDSEASSPGLSPAGYVSSQHLGTSVFHFDHECGVLVKLLEGCGVLICGVHQVRFPTNLRDESKVPSLPLQTHEQVDGKQGQRGLLQVGHLLLRGCSSRVTKGV